MNSERRSYHITDVLAFILIQFLPPWPSHLLNPSPARADAKAVCYRNSGVQSTFESELLSSPVLPISLHSPRYRREDLRNFYEQEGRRASPPSSDWGRLPRHDKPSKGAIPKGNAPTGTRDANSKLVKW